MSVKVYHEPCEVRAGKGRHASVDIVATDVPFNVSEIKRSALSFNEEWDVGWTPLPFHRLAKKLLVPGGWVLVKTGDRTIGPIRDIFSCDHSTTRGYLEWLFQINVLGTQAYAEATQNLSKICSRLPDFEMKALITWYKKSGPHSTRQTTYRSLCEWILVFKRLENGRSVHPPAWSFLSQGAMGNHLECVTAGRGERLYWHLQDSYEEDGELHGTIIPCHNKDKCVICAQAKELGHKPGKDLANTSIHLQRRKHPTQTPLYVWRWLFERHCRQGMRLYDPYCGVAGSLIVAKEFGMTGYGTDSCWEYAEVANMRLEGAWSTPKPPGKIQQLSLLE